MSEKPRFVKAPDEERPVCPHCRQEIREIRHTGRGVLNEKTVFWCSECRCVLGIGSQFNA
jgi:hypothetical protein